MIRLVILASLFTPLAGLTDSGKPVFDVTVPDGWTKFQDSAGVVNFVKSEDKLAVCATAIFAEFISEKTPVRKLLKERIKKEFKGLTKGRHFLEVKSEPFKGVKFEAYRMEFETPRTADTVHKNVALVAKQKKSAVYFWISGEANSLQKCVTEIESVFKTMTIH